MGLFKRRQQAPPVSTPASPPPAPTTCICGETVPAGQLEAHIDTHITFVTMPAGHPGRSFDCPRCGPSDVAYGNPGEHEISLRNISRFMFCEHCKEAHDIDI